MNLLIASNLHLAIWLALAAVALLVLPYVALPLVIKRTFHTPAQPTVVPFDVAENPPPTEVAAFFGRVNNELMAAGFQHVCYGVNANEFGNVTAFLMLSENGRTDDAALSVVAYALPAAAQQNNPVISDQLVSFRRRFTDGTEITTSNTNTPRIFAKVASKQVFRFPQVSNCRTLFALHLSAVNEFGRSAAMPLPRRDQMVDRLMEDMRTETADQVATGYLQLNESRDKYVATWKGAYLMTWPHLWPLKKWQQNSRQRRAAALMRKWSVNLPDAQSAS